MGATIAAMPTNSTMSERDALKLMLVASATNYAEAVTGWAFGSNGAFVNATKQWLAANGLTQTTIVEPTGIDARNTSTPTDLIALARIASANPVVAQIVALPHLDIPDFEQLPNTNDMLGTGGVNGLKTGTLEGSGSNLLFTALLPVGLPDPLSVTGVVLGGFSHESVNLDVTTLLQEHRQRLPRRAGRRGAPGGRHLHDAVGRVGPHGARQQRLGVHLVGHPDHRHDGDDDADDRREGRQGRQRHLDRRPGHGDRARRARQHDQAADRLVEADPPVRARRVDATAS